MKRKEYYFVHKHFGYWRVYFGKNTVNSPEGLNDAVEVANAVNPEKAIWLCERLQQGMSGTMFFVEKYPYVDAWMGPRYTVSQWSAQTLGSKYYKENGEILILTKEEAEKTASFLNKITPKVKRTIKPYYFIHKESDGKWSIYYGVNKYPFPEGTKLSTWENPLDAIWECEGLQNGEAGIPYYCRRLDGKEGVFGQMEPDAPWGIYKYDPTAKTHSIHVETVKESDNPDLRVTELIIEQRKYQENSQG